MDIYIEFTRPKLLKHSLLSRLIRAVEGTSYSHVRLRWTNSVGVNIVYQASGLDVHFLGPTAQDNIPVEITDSYKIAVNSEQYRELIKLCMQNAGINYGYKQLIGILLVKVLKLKKNPLTKGRASQVCSELVGLFLQQVLDTGHELDLDIAGPKDIKHVLDREYR